MMRMDVYRQQFSSAQNYIEVYASLSANYDRPHEIANYVWTAVLSRTPSDIPRDAKGRQVYG